MTAKTIVEQWAAFEASQIPENATAGQRRQMRRAFYAGAGAAYLVYAPSLDVMASAGIELEQFTAEVLEGRA